MIQTNDEHVEMLINACPGEIYNSYLCIVETVLFTKIIKHCKGNKSEAARMLGINRLTLRAKLDRYGIVYNKTESIRDGKW